MEVILISMTTFLVTGIYNSVNFLVLSGYIKKDFIPLLTTIYLPTSGMEIQSIKNYYNAKI